MERVNNRKNDGKNNYKLSVCIPNYNRIERLERLVRTVAVQIQSLKLENVIEICISDDCSQLEPDKVIETVQSDYPTIKINYRKNEQNMGMDFNFYNSVLMAHGEYAWIIGNDDIPTDNAFATLMGIVNEETYRDIDFIVTPFDCFDYDKNLRDTNYPFGNNIRRNLFFDTNDRKQLNRLIMSVERNGALFDFLSNVIFKREHWIRHKNKFDNKMHTLFIQMYMNMQTLLDGAKYLYIPEKIINDYIDDETNETLDRTYKIVVGLYDVFSYFWTGEERRHLERKVLDIFIQSSLFEMDEDDDKRIRLCSCDEEKIEMLKKYYIKKADRNDYFKNKTVIIYGAGNNGVLALEELKGYKANVVGFCDADKNKQGKLIHGKMVFNYEMLKALNANTNVIIVVANHLCGTEIVQQLKNDLISNVAIIT